MVCLEWTVAHQTKKSQLPDLQWMLSCVDACRKTPEIIKTYSSGSNLTVIPDAKVPCYRIADQLKNW